MDLILIAVLPISIITFTESPVAAEQMAIMEVFCLNMIYPTKKKQQK